MGQHVGAASDRCGHVSGCRRQTGRHKRHQRSFFRRTNSIVADVEYTFDFLPGVDSVPVFTSADPCRDETARPSITLSDNSPHSQYDLYRDRSDRTAGQTAAIGKDTPYRRTTDEDDVATLDIGMAIRPDKCLIWATASNIP